MVLEYIVKEKDKNKSINQVLQEQFELSNRLFSKIIKNKMVKLNNKDVDTRLIADVGDKITIDLNYEEENSNIVSKKMKLDIAYEDDGILILNKPAGIVVHPSILHYEDSLASGVKYYFESKGIHKKIRPVNRLDLNTSGLIIFAKNEYVQEILIRQMERGTFSKEYLAIVTGILEQKKGEIDAPIARKEESIIERCVSNNGQKAITKYRVLKEYNNSSLVECKLVTGRTHQIRVHMAYIGHPLLGDTLYGETSLDDIYLMNNKQKDEKIGGNALNEKKSKIIGRQALHCYKISFANPVNGKKMEFKSNVPEDFKKMITII